MKDSVGWGLATLSAVAVGIALIVVLLADTSEAQAQELPVLPSVYSGAATASGSAVPDGFTIVARIGDDYETQPVTTESGRYQFLVVGPPGSLVGRTITFHLDGVRADQTDRFSPAKRAPDGGRLVLNLTFPKLPDPTSTPVPTPTETPIPSPTPQVARPAIYSGFIVVAGADVPAGARLVARIGSYESFPAAIDGEAYRNLVVDPDDFNLIGSTVEFFLNGIKSRTTDMYESAASRRDFDLVFVGIPTPTPTHTATPVPPTATAPPPPTATPVPPTATPTPSPTPTLTPVPPTATPVPPTATPSPTATSVPSPTPTSAPPPPEPTAVVEPAAAQPSPTAEPEADGGLCSSSGTLPLSAALANMLLLVAPIGMTVGMRRFRRSKGRRRVRMERDTLT